MSEESDTEGVIVGLLYEMAADGITSEDQREWRQDIAGRIQRFMTDSESDINRSAYKRGRADALKELASGRTLWTTSGNLKAIESGGDCEINVWTFKPGITDLVPVKIVKMEVQSEE